VTLVGRRFRVAIQSSAREMIIDDRRAAAGGFHTIVHCCRTGFMLRWNTYGLNRGIKPFLQERSGESSLRHIPVQKSAVSGSIYDAPQLWVSRLDSSLGG
jgi:hypothetical protein